MKRLTLFVVLILGLLVGCSTPSTPPADFKTARQGVLDVTRTMEAAYRQGDLKGVARCYADNGMLINSSGLGAIGRTAIDEYWLDMRGKPINWTLENLLVTASLDELLEHGIWKGLERKPPLWSQFDIDLEMKDEYMYQLGISHLERERENGKRDTSVVNFLLVWTWNSDANSYEILVDTYK